MNPDDLNDVNGMQTSFDQKPRKARFNLTALVSLLMFLLVTCVLFGMSLTKVGSLGADVAPIGCGCGGHHGNHHTLLVQVSGEGAVFVDKELHDINELPKLLNEYRERCDKAGHAPQVTVTGDDRARYGALVQAIDCAKTAGIDRVNLETYYRETGQ